MAWTSGGGAAARLVRDGFVSLCVRRAVAVPGHDATEGPDDQQQLLPGHLPPMHRVCACQGSQ